MSSADPLSLLLDLSHELGREERKLAILGEGNTSASVSEDSLLVKASGSNLASLSKEGLTECSFEKLLTLLHQTDLSDEAIDEALLDARLSSDAKKPSVEAMFHAYLLSLPDVNFVGHTHPVEVNKLLCSKHAKTFASRRIFPDEIVCS